MHLISANGDCLIPNVIKKPIKSDNNSFGLVTALTMLGTFM